MERKSVACGNTPWRESRAAFLTLVLVFMLLPLTASAQRATSARIKEWGRLLYSDNSMRRTSAATSLLATYDEDALKTLFDAMAPDQREDVRLSVITAFEVMRDDRGVPRLIDALEDQSQAVREAAASALQKACSTPKSVLLMEASASDAKRTPQTRSKVIGILGEMRSMDSIPTLIGILSDEDASVRKASNAALERITLQNFATVDEWKQWWERSQRLTRIELLEELVKRQADQLRAVTQRMEDLELQILKYEQASKDSSVLLKLLVESDSRKVKRDVLDLLVAGGHKGKEVVAALTEALDDPDAEVRQKCVAALGSQQDPESVPQLIKMLSDPAPSVQAAAARALGGMQSKEAIEALAALLLSPSEEAAKAAAVALGQIGDSRAVQPLIDAISKTSAPTSLQEAAATALANIKDPKAIPVLRNLLLSPNQETRWAAVDALGELQAKDAVADIADVARKDENSQIREHALAALARIGGPAAMDAVVGALSDPVERVASQAFRSLTILAEAQPDLYLAAIDRLITGRQFDAAEKVVTQAIAKYTAQPNHTKEITDLRTRMATGLMTAQEYGRARPYLAALIAANPENGENHSKDLLKCLKAVADQPARITLLAQGRSKYSKDSFWWDETVLLASEMTERGEVKDVLALLANLEKEDPKLGGEKTAAALREIKAKAEAKSKAPEETAGGNTPPA